MSMPNGISQEAWRLARDINLTLPYGHVQSEIARAITAAVTAEREACLDACRAEMAGAKEHGFLHEALGAAWCADAIRTRSKP